MGLETADHTIFPTLVDTTKGLPLESILQVLVCISNDQTLTLTNFSVKDNKLLFYSHAKKTLISFISR